MKKNISRQRRFSFYLIIIPLFLICLLGAGTYAANAQDIKAPVISGVESAVIDQKPVVKGTTQSGTLAHIYVDGVYNGKTEVLFDDSGAADFIYTSFVHVGSGDHMVWAIAENESGSKSKLSNIFKFNILPGVPAPTIFQPAVNKSNISHPFIVGLVKNDLAVKVYVDNQLDGEFKADNHDSGTASFSYQVLRSLGRGRHTVYAVARDSYGKESAESNTVNFSLADPSIGGSVNEEDAQEDIKKEITDENISELLGEELNEENLGEQNNKEEKTSTSLVIFILFIIGIIGWIIWINRELIKEKKKQIKNDNSPAGENEKNSEHGNLLDKK